jgi:calcineurin-like phosphoesterase family protein
MNYFISDIHLGHYNCLSFDKRPFKSLEEQDEKIVSNWNSVITDEDTVYILGDFLWSGSPENERIAKSLKGKKVLIKGNHDSRWLKNDRIVKCFSEINSGYKVIVDDKKRKIVLSHYPILFYESMRWDNTYHLYGHIHTNKTDCEFLDKSIKEYEKLINIKLKMYNVGCMMKYMNYTPQTLDSIIQNGSVYYS